MKKTFFALFMVAALVLAGCAVAEKPATDRAGNPIAVPETVERIISLAPSTSEILDGLGVADKLIAVDTYTAAQLEGTQELPTFDMMTPDCEAIAALMPDVVFTTGMASSGGDNPYQPLIELGVVVCDIPSSSSIEGIKEDIAFVGGVVGREAEAEALTDGLQQEIDRVSEATAKVEEKKTVLFEISALPYLYSFGSGTFLDEMITIIGAENVFGDQEGWISVSEEQAVAANPDVILTSVNYIDDPVGEIKGRAGWENVTAIQNGAVAQIDANASNQACQNITVALEQMLAAVYPDVYDELYQ
ncbi:MAG: ABC transporter substrate-binding protein [Clostridia bacterium]|nr:ABC transporter substrate-binding protein [Clostridia bacterium]